ncbi:glutamate racemase [Treponema zioleckii]|uniref:glutamate racemase n=1 Tax=Treponema zioleckii TaxID=331680 RepID=UPI00168A4722|nr:glutamate racemase [Treponema zioleckii]
MNRIDFAFLDSGTGGVPYMLALKQKNPDARCVFLGDTIHFPYGEKSAQEVTDCASEAIKKIIENWNPRTIVVACNTISVTSLETLRSAFPSIPIVGTVPAIKLAAKVSKNKRIGLLATNATVNHPYSKKLAEDFASDCVVVNRGDPDLVSFIEHDFFTATLEEKKAAIKPAVDFFKKNDCDTIILGCTHFTHIADVCKLVAGDGISVIDSRDGVSNQALRVESDFVHSEKNADEPSKKITLPEDCTFFVTAATKEEESEYQKLCKNCGIPWGGVLK